MYVVVVSISHLARGELGDCPERSSSLTILSLLFGVRWTVGQLISEAISNTNLG